MTERIQTTLGRLAAAERGLSAIGELDLRGAVLYRAAKLQRLALADVAIFTEKKLALITDLGELDGTAIRVKPDRIQEWNTRFADLSSIEVTIEWPALKASDLGDASLKANDYNALIAAGLLVEDRA